MTEREVWQRGRNELFVRRAGGASGRPRFLPRGQVNRRKSIISRRGPGDIFEGARQGWMLVAGCPPSRGGPAVVGSIGLWTVVCGLWSMPIRCSFLADGRWLIADSSK